MSGTSTDFSPNGIRPFGVAFTRGGSAVWFIAVALILGIATLVSSIASGVGLPEQFAVVVGDIRRALGFETELAWSAQDWPAWRDLRSAIVILAMAATPLLAAIQWSGYETLLSYMRDHQSLRVAGPANVAAIRLEVIRTNAWIRQSRFLRVPLAFLSIVISTIIFNAQRVAYGVDSAALESSSWWLDSSVATQIGYVLVAAIGVYAVTVQNLVGCRIILGVWRLRKDISFGADLINADGVWGWRPARTILNATYTEIVVHGIGLAAIILAMPPDGLAYVIVAIPALEWMVTLPFYVFVPLFLIWRGRPPIQDSGAVVAARHRTGHGHLLRQGRDARRPSQLDSADPLPALLVGNALPDRADRQHRHLHRPLECHQLDGSDMTSLDSELYGSYCRFMKQAGVISWSVVDEPSLPDPKRAAILGALADIEDDSKFMQAKLRHTGVLRPGTIRDFNIQWLCEEQEHATVLRALARKRGYEGEPRRHDLLARDKRAAVMVVALRIARLHQHGIAAMYLALGAINEYIALSAYLELAESAPTENERSILKNLARQEGRHMGFYRSGAIAVMEHNGPIVRRLIRLVFERTWRPPGIELLGHANWVQAMAPVLGDEVARERLRGADDLLAGIPGFEGIDIMARFLDRHPIEDFASRTFVRGGEAAHV